jgi:ArsR family transcriptional regulator
VVALAGRGAYIIAMELDVAAKVFAELGNRTRLDILRLLIKAGPDGLAIGEIQEHLEIPASTLAFHMRGIVAAGLVSQEKLGRVVLCRPCFDRINEAVAFLKKECCVGVREKTARSKKVA